MSRPSEIKAVAAAISAPASSAEEAAKLAIKALDESRVERTDYVVVAQVRTYAQAYGPYATEAQAQKAIEKGEIVALDGTRFFVFPLHHPKRHARQVEETDASAISVEATKMWQIARNGGQPAKTHSRRNRKRSA